MGIKMLFPFVFLAVCAFILSITWIFTYNDIVKYVWIGSSLLAITLVPYAKSISRNHDFSKKDIETTDCQNNANNEWDKIINSQCKENSNKSENYKGDTELEVSLLIPHIISLAFNHLLSLMYHRGKQ
jgi:hypothetical protein